MPWQNSGDKMKATLLNWMGDDNTVVDAARVSFKKGHKEFSEEQNHRLIKYLAEHRHYSPFGHCFASFHVKAPVFVRAQLVKHEYLRMNEVSRRYVDSGVEVYQPLLWRKAAPSLKQGSLKEEVKVSTYGTGVCVRCGDSVPRKTAGPRGKWCSERCRAAFRKETDPDIRIYDAKSNADKRGIEFNLKRGDVEWVSHCPLLNVELDYSVSSGKNPDFSPSIDRIDSSKGYTKDNVWVISNKANRMKNDGSKNELVAFAKSILLHFNGQKVPEDGSPESLAKHSIGFYDHLIDEGVAPEMARMVLPQSMYTEWFWSGSLDAFANMCNLRCKPDTQEETRLIANQISEQMLEKFPVSWSELTKWK